MKATVVPLEEGRQGIGLAESRLFRTRCYIDGAWCDADSGESFAVHNPSTLALLAEVPSMGAVETRRAIDAAARALPAWRGKPAFERAALLRRWFDLILKHKEDLARILTSEQGKPIAEARAEVAYAASFVEWYAEECKRIYGDTVPTKSPDRRYFILREPIGVCAAITPWNFPCAMITRKTAPAIAAGCTVVVKPAEQTPLSAFALAELADEAGIPPGVFSVLTGSAPEIGREMTSSPTVRRVSFTGSTEVGRILMRQCADSVKKVSLELGGNAPFIVFDDADVDAAVEGAIGSKYRNTGQTCICANRFLVQAGVHDAFAKKLSTAAAALKVGDGLAPGMQQGPLIDSAALEKVESHVADALAKGAKLLTGGQRHALGGTFFEPTVIAGVTPGMRMFREETFGPVSGLVRFERDEEAVRLANDTEYGLAAYLYSRDVGRAWRTAEAMEYGVVGVNAGLVSTEVAPFGGFKQSGIGREGSKYGIDEFIEIKYVCLGGL